MNQLTAPIRDPQFIEQLIPQKSPFVMVDKLIHFSEGKVISGFTIPSTHLFADQGYFAATGLIENMAQTVALYTGYQYYLKNAPSPTGYIGAIKTVQIAALPQIQGELVTTATILHEIMGVTLVQVAVAYQDAVIASCEMKTILAK